MRITKLIGSKVIKKTVDNVIIKVAAPMFPIMFINVKTDKLLQNAPRGFHPIRKYVYRRECAEVLRTYEDQIKLAKEIRLFNKSFSKGTLKRIEKLKNKL